MCKEILAIDPGHTGAGSLLFLILSTQEHNAWATIERERVEQASATGKWIEGRDGVFRREKGKTMMWRRHGQRKGWREVYNDFELKPKPNRKYPFWCAYDFCEGLKPDTIATPPCKNLRRTAFLQVAEQVLEIQPYNTEAKFRHACVTLLDFHRAFWLSRQAMGLWPDPEIMSDHFCKVWNSQDAWDYRGGYFGHNRLMGLQAPDSPNYGRVFYP